MNTGINVTEWATTPPYERDVSSKFGAPMGRHSDTRECFEGATVQLRKVAAVDSDYDPGGAYWGGIEADPLWCAWGTDVEGDAIQRFVRGRDRDAAIALFPATMKIVHPTLTATTAPDAFVFAYEEAALWSSTTGDEGTPLDTDHSPDDIEDATRAKMRADCDAFYAANVNDLYLADDAQGGHDFWLTRNGHGAGFWDRPKLYGEDQAKRLSEAAKKFGETYLDVSDDGKVFGL